MYSFGDSPFVGPTHAIPKLKSESENYDCSCILNENEGYTWRCIPNKLVKIFNKTVEFCSAKFTPWKWIQIHEMSDVVYKQSKWCFISGLFQMKKYGGIWRQSTIFLLGVVGVGYFSIQWVAVCCEKALCNEVLFRYTERIDLKGFQLESANCSAMQRPPGFVLQASVSFCIDKDLSKDRLKYLNDT